MPELIVLRTGVQMTPPVATLRPFRKYKPALPEAAENCLSRKCTPRLPLHYLPSSLATLLLRVICTLFCRLQYSGRWLPTVKVIRMLADAAALLHAGQKRLARFLRFS